MHTRIKRVVWTGVWVATMVLTAYLCVELAARQPAILAIIMLAAFVASVGLYYAGQLRRDREYLAAGAALGVAVISMAVLIISEFSYWSASIESVHVQVQRDKAKSSGQSLVTDRRRERLQDAALGKPPEQIQAEMALALAKVLGSKTLGAHTAGCTNTAAYHYRSCKPFLDLQGQYAAAVEAKKLEAAVWEDGTRIEDVGIKRDLYQFAVLASKTLGGSVETWTLVIVSLLVALLESLRLFSIYIGWTPDKRTAARVAAFGVSATPVAAESVPPPPGATLPAETAMPKPPVLNMVSLASYRKPEPEPVAPRGRRDEDIDAVTREYLAECCRTGGKRSTSATAVYKHHVEWRRAMGYVPIDSSWFGRSIKNCIGAQRRKAGGATYNLELLGGGLRAAKSASARLAA